MKPSFISLKEKDTEKIKWRKGLSSYLQRVYGSSWSQFYNEKLAKDFDHLRDTSNSDLAAESLLEQNCKYYAYLEHLYLRNGNANMKINSNFVWYEAGYNTALGSESFTQHSIIFEKACTLFNIAVLLTKVADEIVNDDYKTAVADLSKAVGCFEYISENFLNSPSIDLQADNTKFLASLCHAEAQELFLLKLLNGPDPKKQASLISKLSMATAKLYESCHNQVKNPGLKVKSYGLPSWATDINFKYHFYESVTAYYHAIALENQQKFGEAIGFVNLAYNCATSAIPFRAHLKDSFDVDTFRTTVDEYRTQLMRDNDYIYHDIIVQNVQLETVKSMDAIKVVSWDNQLEPFMKEVEEKCDVLFKGIVSIDVYEKESIYSEAKANILRRENEAAEMADLSYTSFIEFTNLPSLLNDLSNSYKSGSFHNRDESQANLMRPQIESWAQLVKNSPYKNIEEQMSIILNKRNGILQQLQHLPESERENAVKLKSSLIEASQSDEKIFGLIKPYAEDIAILLNTDKLWAVFNGFNQNTDTTESLLDIDDTENEKVIQKIKYLQELAEKLRLLKEERGRNLDELKQNINEDDITSLIIKNNSLSESELKRLFDAELEKFDPLSTRIEATIFKQSSIINEIKIELDNIFKLSGFHDKTSKEKEISEKRGKFFERLRDAMSNFSIFTTSISKGLQFYESLQKMVSHLQNISKSSTKQNVFSSPTIDSPPPLQPRPSELVSGMRDLNISSNANAQPMTVPITAQAPVSMSIPVPAPASSYSNAPPPYNVTNQHSSLSQRPAPQIPVSTASPAVPSGLNQPPLPPKNPVAEVSPGVIIDGQERNVRQNPTAFYNNPSVFDENMYSKFSR
ncbi:hypothetical protein Kpol_1024p31 [Vanderwaltozyma polyspora DSM 70294]|uniref:BRO domain-containing protein 1 n=1 Tax=Vanderwaltozyma polyspora (strain ATCC 22028 / DSM 70294 / BCRC 21397 / CBS 2163 / NBRC 10782 / NRRL Y-8283 / UCD 57-17) TaxID=436907 RepID=A7TLJ1_VANPO|nr:uncharacterized protein Kpol_1024p31 [Vanderwaltozyma polyspora DSM 70294]EDO16877.1 hypothetical protein Kpol_1024p31 [Vanderwaltozyma polyspora DSM 70294]